MTVHQLGIYAPYTWDVSTDMACVLGDLAVSLDICVKYLACQACDSGVHPRWDCRVSSSRRNLFEIWALDCSHLIWLQPQRKKLEYARLLGCHNTLIVLWDRLEAADARLFQAFDSIVCPTRSSYQACRNICRGTAADKNIREILWDSGLPFLPKQQPEDTGRQRVLVLLDGRTVRQHGALLFSSLRLLLDALPLVDFTLFHACSWPRATRQFLRDLLVACPGRVTVCRRPSRDMRVAAYGTHHWVWLPALCDSSGFYALEALACNCPVLAYDMPSLNELIRSGHNGHLLTCEWLESGCGAPQARPNSRLLLHSLERVLSRQDYCWALRQRPWSEQSTRRSCFQLAWKALWNLGYTYRVSEPDD